MGRIPSRAVVINRGRRSAVQWADLSHLLNGFERCAEACARLDAYRMTTEEDSSALAHRWKGRVQDIEKRLASLRRRTEWEMDRTTAERLMFDLAAKQRTPRRSL